MDACCHVEQQAHALLYCHVDYMVCCDNIGHVPVDCYGSKVITMATCIHPSLPPFYTIPIFQELVSFLFWMHTTFILYSEEYIASGYLLLFTYLLFLYRVVEIVLCIYANFHCYYGPVIGIYIYFKDSLP